MAGPTRKRTSQRKAGSGNDPVEDHKRLLLAAGEFPQNLSDAARRDWMPTKRGLRGKGNVAATHISGVIGEVKRAQTLFFAVVFALVF